MANLDHWLHWCFAPESKSSSFVLLERMTGREFILAMNEISSLERDPYFNTYNPEYKDPLWKAVIKKIIGWKTTELDKVAVIEHNVISNYRKNVRVKTTKSGAIEISVTHTNPDKLPNINIFMEEVRKLHEMRALQLLIWKLFIRNSGGCAARYGNCSREIKELCP